MNKYPCQNLELKNIKGELWKAISCVLARPDEKSIHSDVYKRLRLFQDRAKNIFPDASNFW